MADVPHLLEIAKSSAVEAGKAIMEVYRSGDFSASIKSDHSPLTKADRCAHSIILDHLHKTGLPVLSEEGKNIVYSERKLWEYFWLTDPLDGTKEFISKNDEFTVNIALMHKNSPSGGVIYVPCSETLYVGSKDTGAYKNEKGKLTQFSALQNRRQYNDLLHIEHPAIVASRSHQSPETTTFINKSKNATVTSMGSSLKFMLLLENRADIYPRWGTTMEWDTAAAHSILNACNRGVYHTNLKSELMYNKPDLRNPPFVAF
jgi:3'(2'), 5'-bisphosphate nucleotidase